MSVKSQLIDHIRALQEDDVRIGEVARVIYGVKVPHIPNSPAPVLRKPSKAHVIEGKLNPEWLIEMRDCLVDFNHQWWCYYGHTWPRLEHEVKALYSEAKQWGIDLKSFAPETLSLSDITQMDKMFEYHESQLDTLADRIQKSHETGLRSLDLVKKKHWASVLRKTAKMQRLCREEIPKSIQKQNNPKLSETWKYLHALRYMLYTMRSKMGSKEGEEGLVQHPIHLIELLMVIACARAHCESHGIPGALIQLAPGHGKSMAKVADRALELNKRPWRGCTIVHNTETVANHRVASVMNHFDDATPEGRRRRALFPSVKRSKKTLVSKLVLELDGKRACPNEEGNLFPSGVHGRVTGISVNEIDFDDPSDEKEAVEAGTRERTNAAIENTWLHRMRGRDSFFVYICTSWHPDDFASKLRKFKRMGLMNIAYYARRCGGPDDDPPFAPLWSESGYDSDRLKREYHKKGPSQYACIFQNNPDSEEGRRVKRLHFFDRKMFNESSRGTLADEHWKKFFDTAKWFLIVDPSGTANRSSDYAGMTYAAYGILRRACVLADGAPIFLDEPKLVFCKFWSARMSQHDLADEIERFSKVAKIDSIVVETVGGFHATVEELVRNRGFDSRMVTARHAGEAGSKVVKLMRYAIHLDMGDALFPGVWGTSDEKGGVKELELDPQWGPLADQIFLAGTVKEDNLLDCVRMQLAEVSYDLMSAKGIKGYLVDKEGPRIGQDYKRMMAYYNDQLKKQKPKPSHRPRNTTLLGRKMSCLN